jgi:hypothetical protein
MDIDIIPIYEQPLIRQFKGNLSTPETIIIVSVRHLHTEPSVLLL